MADDSPIEPDLTTYICDVLDGLQAGRLNRDAAAVAIMEHPLIEQALRLKVIRPLELGDGKAPRS